MTKAKNHLQIHQMTVAQFEKLFPYEDACKAYLVKNRWPDGVKCPRCDNENVHEHNVVARVIDNADARTLDAFVHETVSHKVSLLPTDDHAGYRYIGRDYPHEFVRHSRGEYVVGAVHTNTIEGFWSIVKRGIVCTFHKVSKKYLPLDVNEFEFRYNNRKNPDIFGAAIKAC